MEEKEEEDVDDDEDEDEEMELERQRVRTSEYFAELEKKMVSTEVFIVCLRPFITNRLC